MKYWISPYDSCSALFGVVSTVKNRSQSWSSRTGLGNSGAPLKPRCAILTCARPRLLTVFLVVARPSFRCSMGWLDVFQATGAMAFEDTGTARLCTCTALQTSHASVCCILAGRKVEPRQACRQNQASAYWSSAEVRPQFFSIMLSTIASATPRSLEFK